MSGGRCKTLDAGDFFADVFPFLIGHWAPYVKWPLPLPSNHSPTHYCRPVFFFCTNTVLVPPFIFVTTYMVEAPIAPNLNGHLICKPVVFPLLLYCPAHPHLAPIL